MCSEISADRSRVAQPNEARLCPRVRSTLDTKKTIRHHARHQTLVLHIQLFNRCAHSAGSVHEKLDRSRGKMGQL